MSSRYNLRQNNYKCDLRKKNVKEIQILSIQIDKTDLASDNDTAIRIRLVRNIYLLVNNNFDLFENHSHVLDSANNRIQKLNNDLNAYTTKYPTRIQKTCKSALLQFQTFKQKYKNYWANITATLNKKTCGDMTREILQFIRNSV